jgi:hypothetical protein
MLNNKYLLSVFFIANFCSCFAIKDIMEDMKSYNPKDNYVHFGNSYEHTIWVVRCMAKLIKDKESPWTDEIDLAKYRNILILTAFFHDIGKREGDSGHPERGFDYLRGHKTYKFKEKSEILDLKKIASECRLSDSDMSLIAILVKMSHKFGDFMSSLDVASFLASLSAIAKELNYPMSDQLVKMCILLAVADVKGFGPIDYEAGMFDGITYCPDDWTKKISVPHPSSNNGWNNFGYQTNGPARRESLLTYYNDHKSEYEAGNEKIILAQKLSDLAKNLNLLKAKISTLSARLTDLKSKLSGI